MNSLNLDRAVAFLSSLPERYRGPGGVAGIVHNGKVVARHAWGFADLTRHARMDYATPLPICSISKQFTCATLLSVIKDPARFDGRLRAALPNLQGPLPTTAQLCHNQSGLRDYWALTVLHGAVLDGVFRQSDAAVILARMNRTHFVPGTSYSYSNGNYRILCDLLEAETDRSLAELYQQHIFEQAGMQTATLTTDTAFPAGDVTGYEGRGDIGFFPATNRIFWKGDAGLSASLDDMLAWESFIDATRDNPDGLYRRIAVPQCFSDGTPARYGFGLKHEKIGGHAITGHGGALRGFRSQRLHAAKTRLSVVVLFNHDGSAYGAARGIMAAALEDTAVTPPSPDTVQGWEGNWFDAETGLVLSAGLAPGNRIRAHYAVGPELLTMHADGTLSSAAMSLQRMVDGQVSIHRPGENYYGLARRITGTARQDIAGRYICDELQAAFEIVQTGSGFYGAASGFLGTGAMQPLHPLGDDLWAMPCQRSMDAPAPGDWTLRVMRHGTGDGNISGLELGCWLSRHVSYRRVA